MANITILTFDKDGMLEGPLPVVGPEITDVVLIAHGWNETREDACDHYQHLVDPLEAILSQNAARWQGHTVAYFGVIWPAAKYADGLTVINMQADIRGAPHAGTTSPPLNDADLKAHARDVAQLDIPRLPHDVRFGPEADILRCGKKHRLIQLPYRQ